MRTSTATIHGAFARCVAEDPDAIAVIHAEARRTYAELDRDAEALGRRLYEFGVRPGMLVPVLLDRSVGLICSLLAILKCGAGYAALDPRWPAGRTASILRRLDAPLVVTTQPAVPGARGCLAPDAG